MPFRFLWNATRGHRLMPWRSEYLKWRIETYSGRKADTIDAAYFWFFLWKERAQLMRFLGLREILGRGAGNRLESFFPRSSSCPPVSPADCLPTSLCRASA